MCLRHDSKAQICTQLLHQHGIYRVRAIMASPNGSAPFWTCSLQRTRIHWIQCCRLCLEKYQKIKISPTQPCHSAAKFDGSPQNKKLLSGLDARCLTWPGFCSADVTKPPQETLDTAPSVLLQFRLHRSENNGAIFMRLLVCVGPVAPATLSLQ